MSTLIERLLQKALDEANIFEIDQIMPKIYPDYDYRYAKTLIIYNEECGIDAYDLYRLKGNFPNMPFMSLFHFEVNLIRGLCNISEEDLAILNPPCGNEKKCG
jgi:hypothetical protein